MEREQQIDESIDVFISEFDCIRKRVVSSLDARYEIDP